MHESRRSVKSRTYWLLIISPFLLALHPILSLYNHNRHELNLSVLIAPTIVVLTLSGVLLLWFYLVFRNIARAALFLSLLIFFIFLYSPFTEVVNVVLGYLGEPHGQTLLVIGWIILFVLISVGVLKLSYKRDALKTMKLFIISSSILVILLPTVEIIRFENARRVTFQSFEQTPTFDDVITTKRTYDENIKKPDIYYLIFDRYASMQTLREFYDYDNTPLLDYLEEKGFYIVDKPYSNYPFTDLSLASSLNMMYLDSLQKKLGSNSTDFQPIYRLIQNNAVAEYLHSLGYLYVHFGESRHPATNRNPYAEVNYQYSRKLPISEFSLLLVRSTFLYAVLQEPLSAIEKGLDQPLSPSQLKREIIPDELNKLGSLPDVDKPLFVFEHIMLPHEDYVYDRDGNQPRIPANMDSGKRRELYVGQLSYTNLLIQDLVDRLLKNTNGDAIIIIQADEGPWPTRYRRNVPNFNWATASEKEVQEKFGIINAIYFPDKSAYSSLYDSITPVNTFRVIFNEFFGEDLPILKDKIFGVKSKKNPYDYIELTKKIKKESVLKK